MSSSHNGGYCQHKDKMMMSEERARSEARRIRGMRAYKCNLCGAWHMSTRRGAKGAQRKRGESRPWWAKGGLTKSDDVFEVRTKDYDPDQLVLAIPPADYTGTVADWLRGMARVRIMEYHKGRPLIRKADHARLVYETEP